jgi:hypothetical protein
VSNGSGVAALMVTVATLTGMAHLHGGAAHRHTRHHWARHHAAGPDRAELGGTRIPVRVVRTDTPGSVHNVAYTGKSAAETPQVIVGYVDPHRGPAAFHHLTRMVEGDRVKVVRKDHSVAWFRVDSIGRGQRTLHVRHQGERPRLRLISRPDPGERQRDVVVEAHLDRR